MRPISHDVSAFADIPQGQTQELQPPAASPCAPRPSKPLSRKVRERSCLVMREAVSPESLIRFVVDPQGILVPDIAENLPGRGYWVTASAESLETAIQKNLFSRAARKRVEIPAHMCMQTIDALRTHALEVLSLANRAGQVAAGFEKAYDVLRTGKAGVYVSAAQPGSDSRRKLESLGAGLPIVSCFSEEALSRVTGRDRTVHLVVREGGLCAAFLRDIARLRGLVGQNHGTEEENA